MYILKILCNGSVYAALLLFLISLVLQLLIRLPLPIFASIHTKAWYGTYNDIATIVASICTVGAFILTVAIYKESKAISISVEKVVKSKNFELTEYKEFMVNVNKCIEILRQFLLNTEEKGQSAYREAAFEFREMLNGVNFILKNYKNELSIGLDENAKKELDRVNAWIAAYLVNISDVIVNYEENNKLYDILCTLKALSKNFEHAK